MSRFFSDYESSGAGISKNVSKKKGLALYFDILFRKFWLLIGLNLLYFIFFIPLVAAFVAISFMKNYELLLVILGLCFLAFTVLIGPATAGMTKVIRSFVIEKHTFVVHDFFKAFRKNFKKSLFIGVADVIIGISAFASYNVYPGMVLAYKDKMSFSEFFYVPMIITFSLTIVMSIMNFYLYLMLIATDLTIKELYKNAFFLSFLGMKINLVSLFICVLSIVIMGVILRYTPPLFMILIPLIPSSLVWFTACFNSYPVIQKYVINPYYESLGKINPELVNDVDAVEEETLFVDMGGKERPVEKRKKGKGKRIS